jgi:competence protein ComEA
MSKLFLVIVVLLSGCQSLQPFEINPHQFFTITIDGAIKNPGQYEIEPFMTIGGVLEMIELLDDSDTSSLNVNIILHHRDKLTIPFIQDQACININHASLSQLTQLSQIGEVIGQRIIDYRVAHGLFQTIEQLMLVKGIGEKTFEKNKDLICV